MVIVYCLVNEKVQSAQQYVCLSQKVKVKTLYNLHDINQLTYNIQLLAEKNISNFFRIKSIHKTANNFLQSSANIINQNHQKRV
jgi:hypothetical protein